MDDPRLVLALQNLDRHLKGAIKALARIKALAGFQGAPPPDQKEPAP